MNLSLNRIILFVNDVQQLKLFYQQNFQFQLSEEIANEWVVLATGSCELALHKAGPHSPSVAPENNNAKLVFQTTASLRQLREQLVRNNVEMKEVRSFGNSPYLFCDGKDIEGNIFQIMQRVN